ncbi:MAG TPA: TRAP transporter small permease [Beijerinckiaceae bacterium]
MQSSAPAGRRRSPLAVLETLTLVVSALVVAMMAAHVMADVSARVVFGRPLDGSTEIVSRYYMVAVIFLPLAYLHAEQGHVAAGLLSDLLPERGQRVTEALSHLLMAAFAALLAWRCGLEALRATESGEKLQTAYYFLPTWPARWMIPFAAALLVLRALAMAWESLRAAAPAPAALDAPPRV